MVAAAAQAHRATLASVVRPATQDSLGLTPARQAIQGSLGRLGIVVLLGYPVILGSVAIRDIREFRDIRVSLVSAAIPATVVKSGQSQLR